MDEEGVFYDGKWGARAVRSAGRHMVATGQADMKYSHCCVNNMPRGFINAAESFVMSDHNGNLFINLYSDFECKTASGNIRIHGDYLSHGKVTVELELTRKTNIHLRSPAWSNVTLIDGIRVTTSDRYMVKTLDAGSSTILLEFDMTPVIREFNQTPIRFPDNDFRISRFISGNSVPTDVMTFDRRAVILRGPLLLTRSKLVGNSKEEMFDSETICGKGYEITVLPIQNNTVRAAFQVYFRNSNGSFKTNMCDFASGSNRWSENDDHLFNIFM